jgi:hypothetical protein
MCNYAVFMPNIYFSAIAMYCLSMCYKGFLSKKTIIFVKKKELGASFGCFQNPIHRTQYAPNSWPPDKTVWEE